MTDHIEKTKQEFDRYVDSQAEKGLEKYGKPLNPLDGKYDWMDMAMEEGADLIQYMVAEKTKRDYAIKKIREIIRDSDLRFEIDMWLSHMEGEFIEP